MAKLRHVPRGHSPTTYVARPSLGSTIAGVIAWLGAGAALCLLVFLTINVTKRSRALDRQVTTLKKAQQAEITELTDRLDASLDEIQGLDSQNRSEAIEIRRKVDSLKADLKRVERQSGKHRKRMKRQIESALVGVDVTAMFGENADLSQVDPDTILEQLREHQASLQESLEELNAELEVIEANAQAMNAGPVEDPVDPAKVDLGVDVRKRYIDDPEGKRGKVWVVDYRFAIANKDQTRQIEDLTLHFVAYGKHLTRDDTYVLIYQGRSPVIVAPGMTASVDYSTPIYIGRDEKNPSHLDCHYAGYAFVLIDHTGAVVKTEFSEKWMADTETELLLALGRGDMFDRDLNKTDTVAQ